jgi:hypothetical protein
VFLKWTIAARVWTPFHNIQAVLKFLTHISSISTVEWLDKKNESQNEVTKYKYLKQQSNPVKRHLQVRLSSDYVVPW